MSSAGLLLSSAYYSHPYHEACNVSYSPPAPRSNLFLAIIVGLATLFLSVWCASREVFHTSDIAFIRTQIFRFLGQTHQTMQVNQHQQRGPVHPDPQKAIAEALALLTPATTVEENPDPPLELSQETEALTFRGIWEVLLPKLHYIPTNALGLVKRALETAMAIHGTEVTSGGRLSILHPLETAQLMAEIEQDAETVSAALLHDCVGENKLKVADIRQMFGDDVGCIVEGTVAISNLPFVHLGNADEEQVENLRQMFMIMAKDWRIILVQLADRLDIMRSIEQWPAETQQQLARETLEIYGPLAHRLGIWDFKSELEELGFRYMHPLQHAIVKKKLDGRLAEMTEALQGGGLAIQLKLLEYDPELQKNNVTIVMKGRIKGVYSVWAKMHYSNRDFESIKDLVALRVILDLGRRPQESDIAFRQREEAMCYHTMKVIQSMPRLCCNEFSGKMKDFIASPKANGYQSLHTMVSWKNHLIEVQVRSQSMHYVAEYGLAAHWIYKDRLKDLNKMPSYQVAWLQPLVQWKRQMTRSNLKDQEPYSPAEFAEVVRRELMGKRVLMFTPGGKIVNFHKGATVLHAMDQLHPSIAPFLLRAEVDGVPVPFWYRLQTGQTLHITTRAKRGSTAAAPNATARL